MRSKSALFALFAFALFPLFAAHPQSPAADHPGIALYKAGKYKEAAASLSAAVKSKESKSNGELWNFLGLANHQLFNDKNARKAFETATKLAPANVVYRTNYGYALLLGRKINEAQSHLQKALALEPKNVSARYFLGVANIWEGKNDSALNDADQLINIAPKAYEGYVLKSDALIAKLGEKVSKGTEVRDEVQFLKNAVDVLETGATLVADAAGKQRLRSELEAKNAFYKYFTKPKPDPTALDAPPEPGVTPLKVTRKFKAQYTDRARQANVQGTVTLAVLFGAAGRIEHILPIKRIGYGLDEQAVTAASKMEFEPQKKDGGPVSTVRLVSFSFNIY